jgi:large repetitive protein
MNVTVNNPKSGPIGGGTPVEIEIEGKSLDEDTLAFGTVNFGDVPATDVRVETWNQTTFKGTIIATSPPGRAGKVDVSVITPGGTEAKDEQAFTYEKGALTSIEPDEASVTDVDAKKILVIIKGSQFIDVKSVKFGEQSACSRSISDCEIWARVPSLPDGTKPPVQVLVSVEAKSGVITKDNAFKYVAPPKPK